MFNYIISMLLSLVFAAILNLADPVVLFAENQALPALTLVPADRYPLFEDDMALTNLAEAIQGSIAYYGKLPDAKRFVWGEQTCTAAHMLHSLQRFLSFIERRPSQKEVRAFINHYYDVYAYQNNETATSVLFTGYYEPLLHGSLNRTEVFKYPVYSRPDDLVTFDGAEVPGKSAGNNHVGRYDGNTVIPYYTRQQITQMPFPGISAQPIAWVSDPVSLFFLHIQGSGKIRFENGRTINVHYQISNGYPYKSIGKYLIDKQKMSKETVSMQSIREYLNAHPEERNEIFNYNPRYIFFETVEKGPVGCFNIELTPGRSIALDRRTAPAGALVFVQTQKPELDASGKISQWARFSRFFLNQDTGSAIQGSERADIFWGNGHYAELAAGYMKHPGHLYFLVLKPDF